MGWFAARHGKRYAAALAGAAAAAAAGVAVGYFYSAGPGKRSVWAELLDGLDLRGDECVLDVGCGRGAVLMLAASRLPRGRAVGADVWRQRDQSGNRPSATLRNAAAEGVLDRVEVVSADARRLPFPDESFDIVVSNLTISNISSPGGRQIALREAVRVLRRGGRILIADQGAQRYARVLREEGCSGVGLRRLDGRTSYGVPGHHIDLVTATRPG